MNQIMLTLMLASLAFGLVQAAPTSAEPPTWKRERPLVIAHRGACGYRPEHTLEGYKLAIDMGADFIEPDLVATKDGELIARHEPMLSTTTDVATHPEFASRKSTRAVDGEEKTDWFAGDFTLAEIKQLRARQAMTERDPFFNDKFQIPTLREIIALAKTESARTGRTIGIYPETKHPTFHKAIGLPLEDRLLTILKEVGWTEKSSPVIIQSMEPASLKYLRARTNVRLMQLISGSDIDKEGRVVFVPPDAQPFDFVVSGDKRTFADMVTKSGLAEIKTYADGIGVWKPYLLPSKQLDRDGDGKPDDLNGDGVIDERDRVLLRPTSLVADGHAAGLFVHAWSFRNEPRRLTSDFGGDPVEEYKAFYALGVDGVFTDFADTAVKAR
jgi:glycerophosphoryl diester phosphodiesterase